MGRPARFEPLPGTFGPKIGVFGFPVSGGRLPAGIFKLQPGKWVAFFLLILCWGCTPSRTLPPSVEKRFNYTPSVAAKYTVNEEWWKVYEDKELDRVVALGLANNIDYARAAVQVNLALYRARRLGADLVPVFSGSGDASARKNTKTGERSVRTFDAELSVTYEIDLWRKLADSVSAMEWEHKATEEDRAVARLALINNTIDAYFNLAYLNAAMAATRRSIDNYSRLAEAIKTKQRFGKADALEVELADSSLLDAEANLIDLEVQNKTAAQTLQILLNISPEAALPLRLPDILAYQTPEVNLDVPVAVLARRPDLKAAEFRLQKAFKDLSAAYKSLYPAVSLRGILSSSSDRARTMLDVPFALGGISIDLPFLQWNAVRWDIKISEAEYDLLRLDFEKSITAALHEVDLAWFNYASSRRDMANAAQRHKHDLRISGYYRTRYELGKAELSDWLSALNTAVQSELDLLRSRYQTLLFETAVYKAMAGRYTQYPQ